ncbi:MAG TPA: serine/threonine-protein kinase [Kofleriaceae bacterium]
MSTETAAQDSSPLQSALIGRELAGRFRILAKLGEGGMGAVYRGEQMSLKRAVAVKLLKPELSQNEQLLRRFSAEAEAVAKLDHPNTVKVYDSGRDTDGSLFIAMEYIEGQSLREVMRSGALPGPRALAIGVQVAASLADAHAHSIVHRDLKPDNVMLQDKGRQRDIVRVLDFGIAKLRDDSRATQQMTQAGDMLGTPQYMAPEQIRGESIDGRTDIYALGCMLYEMVTGRLPFEGTSVMAILSKHLTDQVVPPSQRRPDLGLSGFIDQIVLAGMAKDPAARPLTMDRYGEMIAGTLAAIDPPGSRSAGHDPNRSAGYVSQTPVAVTPMPMAVPATPAPTPIPPTVRGVGAASPRATQPVQRSRSWLPWAIAAGVLGIGGIGAAAYLNGRTKHDVASSSSSGASDPWQTDSSALPTGLMLVPAGARLVVPPGFTQLSSGPNGISYANRRGQFVALGPLAPGTNDPQTLTSDWESRTSINNPHFETQGAVDCLGHLRQTLVFSATVDGVPVVQDIVLLISPEYRLGLLVQFRTSDPDGPALLESIESNGVVIP